MWKPEFTSAVFAIIPFTSDRPLYEGWNFNSSNYLFTTDTK